MQMRRKDRERDRVFAESIVDKCVFATLGTVSADGTPYCVPVSIARAGEWIYFHCAKEGHKTDNLRYAQEVCLSCVGETHQPEKEFTVGYESATVFGKAEEVCDRTEKVEALKILCLRHVPCNMENFEQEMENKLHLTAVWKIHMTRITGKQRKL